MNKSVPNYGIQEENTQLQALIAALDDIVFEISADKIFLNVWARDEDHLFMPKEEFINKSVSETVGELEKPFNELMDNVLISKEPSELIYKHPEKEVWYKTKATLINPEAPREEQRIAVKVKEVTQSIIQEQALKQTKEELVRSNELLTHSQKLSNSGGWTFTLATGEIFWTDQTYRIYNIPIGKTITYEDVLNLYIEEDKQQLDKLVEEAIKEGMPYEMTLKTPSGKHIHIIGEPIFENNEVVKLSGAVMDVTQRIEFEQELIQARNNAIEAAHAKTNFLSIMSHEIRTPLNGIIGIANLLGENKSKDQEELIDNLIYSSNHLLQLVNDILDLNKMQSEKLTLIREHTSLKKLIDNICGQFNSFATNKELEIIYNVDEQIPEYIIADSIRLGQILNNLVNNAIKFTAEGSVTISAQFKKQNKNKVWIAFSVKDTGPGIAKEDQERIFEPFEQVEQNRNRKHAGTGLGLQITKMLVELKGGKLELDSEPGKGANFHFILSFDIPTEQDKATDSIFVKELDLHKEAFANLKLLLAEDNPVNTLVAKKQLEQFGITPTCVADGKQALEKFRQEEFNAALVDLHMPEVDGFQLATQIRKNYPKMHIIIFTADITDDARERLSKLNVRNIINKPFKPKEMYKVLLKVID